MVSLSVAGARSLAGAATTRARCDTRGRATPGIRTTTPVRVGTRARVPGPPQWSGPAAAAPSSSTRAATWSARSVRGGSPLGGRLGFRIGGGAARPVPAVRAKADRRAKDDLIDDDLLRRAMEMADDDFDDVADEDELRALDMLDETDGAIDLDDCRLYTSDAADE